MSSSCQKKRSGLKETQNVSSAEINATEIEETFETGQKTFPWQHRAIQNHRKLMMKKKKDFIHMNALI